MNRIPAFMALLLIFVSAVRAQDIPEIPAKPRLVNDFAGVLSDDEEALLERKLLSWEDSTSNQLCIVLVNSLGGYDVADFSVRLAEKWGIGSKKNNGVLLLAAMEDRKSRIEVGYGLEGRITDAVSRRILADYLKPAFKEKRYAQGLNETCDRIMEAAAGEYKAEPVEPRKKNRKTGMGVVVIILIILYLLSRNRRGGGGGFLTGMLLGNMLGGHRHSSWGDFSSGGGSFGGFGGGSFGGGGSSGDW